jgi:3-oxoacyl-[acyl-carrier protein] reductase
VTNRDELARAAQTIRAGLGSPDVLAAFAGGQGAPVATVEETAAHWNEVIEENLTATFLTVNAFLSAMIERRRGSIITMSSSAARQALRSSAAYAAAKGGIVVFTRHLANELARNGIRVNALAPATTENDRMRAAMSQEQLGQLAASFPLGRLGQPADIAQAAMFLASEASSWITGLTLDVAGGQIML